MAFTFSGFRRIVAKPCSSRVKPSSLTNKKKSSLTHNFSILPLLIRASHCKSWYFRVSGEDSYSRVYQGNVKERIGQRSNHSKINTLLIYVYFCSTCRFYLVNTRMRSKRDIKMGRLCTPGGAVVGIVGGGVTFRFYLVNTHA